MRKCGRNGTSSLLMLFASMDGGLRRTWDKDGRVKSRAEFEGKLGRFKKGVMN